MSKDPETCWTDADFDSLSWHDNHVHGLGVSEGQYESGELVLDLDFIVEWIGCDTGRVQFRIAPASLTFHEVTHLKIQLDYCSASAAMCPFSIAGIERRRETREKYTATVWKIPVNWPTERFPLRQLVSHSVCARLRSSRISSRLPWRNVEGWRDKSTTRICLPVARLPLATRVLAGARWSV